MPISFWAAQTPGAYNLPILLMFLGVVIFFAFTQKHVMIVGHHTADKALAALYYLYLSWTDIGKEAELVGFVVAVCDVFRLDVFSHILPVSVRVVRQIVDSARYKWQQIEAQIQAYC